ncbi:hypothetical protein [Deinococcus sonorensis]|uniref:DUF937 domain-containing protein n=2 Tax=Deinococcus sonorensis TaxID=309891 RepID=A0AAU7U740_9DEIO
MFEHILQQMGSLGASSQHFAQAQQTGQDDQVDPNHAAEYVQHVTQHASPEAQQQVFGEYVCSLSSEQRQALGLAMVQHPGIPVQSVQVDDDQSLTQALGTSTQALSAPGQGGLGGLFGMFGQAMGGQSTPQASQLGGMSMGQSAQPGGFDVGSLLQNPVAKAGLVGLAGIIGSRLLNQQ